MKKYHFFALAFIGLLTGFSLFPKKNLAIPASLVLEKELLNATKNLKTQIETLENQLSLSQLEIQKLKEQLQKMQTIKETEQGKSSEFEVENKRLQENELSLTKQIGLLKQKVVTKKRENISPYQISTDKKLDPKLAASLKKSFTPYVVSQLESLTLSQRETIKFWRQEYERTMNQLSFERMKNFMEENSFDSFDFESQKGQEFYHEIEVLRDTTNQNIFDILTIPQRQRLNQLAQNQMNSSGLGLIFMRGKEEDLVGKYHWVFRFQDSFVLFISQ